MSLFQFKIKKIKFFLKRLYTIFLHRNFKISVEQIYTITDYNNIDTMRSFQYIVETVDFTKFI